MLNKLTVFICSLEYVIKPLIINELHDNFHVEWLTRQQQHYPANADIWFFTGRPAKNEK